MKLPTYQVDHQSFRGQPGCCSPAGIVAAGQMAPGDQKGFVVRFLGACCGVLEDSANGSA